MLHDVILVGSGAAGTAAALGLRGVNLLVLDVGRAAGEVSSQYAGNIFSLKRSGVELFDDFIGSKYESLHNVVGEYLSPKLKAPQVKYITEQWRELGPVLRAGFNPEQSYAKGGLANAWGAGAFRFSADDLREFPFSAQELEPHYKYLTEHMGISGCDDDLTPFFGPADGCQPPLELNRLGRDLLAKYTAKRAYFNNRGIHIGQPRMAVLTREHRGRQPYDYRGLEFFLPRLPAIYNPAFTLEELVREKALTYRDSCLVQRYEDKGDRVLVYARNLTTGEEECHAAKRLVLAAGALNSARIVLRSRGDRETRLPLLDNQISYVPLVNLKRIGSGVDGRALPIQLNMICTHPVCAEPVQGSIYGVTATLWNDFMFDFPLPARGAMAALRYFLPAMAIVQLFYADRPCPENYLQLKDDDRLCLHYEGQPLGRVEKHLVRSFWRLGWLGLAGLCKYPPPGNSFHYAGALPMRENPGRYETDPQGRLEGKGNVLVADPAVFPVLPARNLTFTNMANARRIGVALRMELEGK